MIRTFLFLLMFMIIYAPKIGGRIDALSIFCGVSFVLALLAGSFSSVRGLVARRVFYCGVGFLFMAAYSLWLVQLNDLNDYYQPLRFMRALINTIGVFSLASLYYHFFRGEATRLLILHVWLCIITHACLMLVMFASSSINLFIIDHVVVMDSEASGYVERAAGKRIGGLTNSWDATSAIQAMGILLIPSILKFVRTWVRKVLVILTIPISIFAMAISGTTGFLILVAIGALTTLIYGSIKYKVAMCGGALALFLGAYLSIGIISQYASDEVRESSIYRTAFMLLGSQSVDYARANRASDARETIHVIFNSMYFFPETFSQTLLGNGGSGRSADYVVEADPGPTLNLHNLGIIFCIFLYFFVATSIVATIRIGRAMPACSSFGLVILCTLFIVDLKVQYLLARNSLSFMMLALIVIWYETARWKREQRRLKL